MGSILFIILEMTIFNDFASIRIRYKILYLGRLIKNI